MESATDQHMVRMSEDLPHRMPEVMPERMSEGMPAGRPEGMPDRMLERSEAEDVPVRMPEDRRYAR